jgi:dephospho-CoA kinase
VNGERHVVLTIGLTGPIGCGKSTIAGWLADRGAAVVDADRLARAVVERGTPAFEAVVATFGTVVLTADGDLDRAALGRLVFDDADALRRLEAIVHPAVRPRIVAALEAARVGGASIVVLEAILLVEGGYGEHCDEVWLVTCDRAAQLARLADRGMAAADAARRIAAQEGLVERLTPVATRIIDTRGDRAATEAGVAAALAAALADHRPAGERLD